jgi:hypothetical protein
MMGYCENYLLDEEYKQYPYIIMRVCIGNLVSAERLIGAES